MFFLFGACQPEERHPNETPIIMATTGMVADMVRNIVRDSAIVIAIMNPGVDPHLYKASQGDLRIILESDYIVYNGLYLEGRLSRILEKQASVKPVIEVGAQLRTGIIELDADTYDPHIWFDVALWKEAMLNTAEVLAGLDTLRATAYLKNAMDYAIQLDSLDNWVQEEINRIPQRQRVLITAHDAFSYFGMAYGIKVLGLQGLSTLSEFGLRDVSDLVNYITTHEIPAIFVETSVSDRSLQAVLAGVRQRGGTVRIGGSLYSDAMGQEGTPEGTYIGMITHNVNTIVEALTQ